jgi:AraC-like DNA-binding protein
MKTIAVPNIRSVAASLEPRLERSRLSYRQILMDFAHVTNGREDWAADRTLPRHRHLHAYAALVLTGGYEECGSRGRFRVGPGDVLLHDAFDAHLNRFRGTGAQVLNLVIESSTANFTLARVSDPDTIARTAERDAPAAAIQLRSQLCELKSVARDWMDLLAFDLLDDPNRRLDEWAARHDLASETLSRGFAKVFGVTPATFRSEARSRRALAMITDGGAPLAAVAAETGFADQSHMSRAVRSLTGLPPFAWRRSNSFKTARARSG